MSGIGNVLGKIFAGGAEKIVNSISKAIDDNITNKEEKMILNNEMQKIVTAHVQEMEKLSIERARLEIEDRDSARKMQIAALAQNDTFSKRFVYYLAAFVLLSATGFGFGLFFWVPEEENRRMIEMFADVYLFAGAMVVLNFFFGSSKGSHDKDEAIKEAMNKR